MRRIPLAQQHNAPPPRGPHDHDTRPCGRTQQRAPAQRDQLRELTSPHRRQGDRASGNDDSAAHRLPIFGAIAISSRPTSSARGRNCSD